MPLFIFIYLPPPPTMYLVSLDRACSSYLWALGGLHPEQLISPSQGETETNNPSLPLESIQNLK